MASSIDATKPTAGAALTADVRNNFSAAKSEIEALQAAIMAYPPTTAQVQALFAGGRIGGMWDFGDTATLFQDYATPVTAVTQPIGIVLDKSQGLILGSELVTNGDFSGGTTGWVPRAGAATHAVVGGEMEVTAINTSDQVTEQSFSVVPGRTYKVTGTMRAAGTNSVANSARISILGATVFSLAQVPANGVQTPFSLFATANSSTFQVQLSVASFGAWGAIGDKAYFDNISIKEIPGNHATQPTAGSRPTYSARKNLLVKSEDFADAVWSSASSSLGAATVFSSGNVANLVLDTAANGQHTRITNTSTAAGAVTVSFKVRKKDLDYVVFRAVQDGILCYFNVSSGTTGAISGAATTSISASGADFVCVVQFVTAGDMQLHFGVTPADATLAYVGSGVGNYIGEPQVETGSTATRYQRVNTASDYDAVVFPAFARFDGVDDSLTVGAITLGANMDCFVAVRRNAATKFIIGSGTTNSTKWFAVVENGSAGAADDSVGIAATYVVDGAPINGGLPIVTRGQLAAALPIGGWHVIEVRNLDLSRWSSLYFSGFSGFPLDGEIGGVVLCAAQSTANRNLVRRYLGAKVGLTL